MASGENSELQIIPIGVRMGAIVQGVDLRAPWPESTFQAVQDALYAYQVLIFREQDLTRDEQVKLGDRFGSLQPAQPHRFLGETSKLQILTRSKESRPYSDVWHTDVPIMENTPLVGILAAELVPSLGGDTMWASTYGLYETLSDSVRRFCDQLQGEHVIDVTLGYVRRKYDEDMVQKVAAEFPPRRHPLVQTHPMTGRKHFYYSGNWMSRIVGLTPPESELLMGFIERGLDDPNIQLRWHWSQGDIALWDLRSTVHKGLSDHWETEPDRILRSAFVEVDPAQFVYN